MTARKCDFKGTPLFVRAEVAPAEYDDQGDEDMMIDDSVGVSAEDVAAADEDEDVSRCVKCSARRKV